MLTYKICQECIQTLENYGFPVFDTYMKIIFSYVEKKKFFYLTCNCSECFSSLQILEFLEKKNYVISLETDEGLFLKPLGIKFIEDGTYQVCFHSEESCFG